MAATKKRELPAKLRENAEKLKRGEPLHGKRSSSKPRSSPKSSQKKGGVKTNG